jgi:glycosyltransferase involved in cell wall biosynthesis
MPPEGRHVKQNTGNILFLKWFLYDKRNEAISAAIGADCRFITSLTRRKTWTAPLRYVMQFAKTLALLLREKPAIVFVTNPPIFAAGTVALACRFTGGHYIIDSHTGAFDRKWNFAKFLHRMLARQALLTIVTNNEFEKIYRNWGADVFLLGDLVLDIPLTKTVQLSNRFNIAVICSFDPDEPVWEILEAAKGSPDATFYITGNPERAGRSVRETRAENIVFTGFLPDADYFDLLHACDAIMALVNRDNTMQQGAYEAVSVRKPMILSDWELLRDTYGDGAVYVKSDVESIRGGIARLRQGYAFHQERIRSVYQERKKIWDGKCAYLRTLTGAEIASPNGTMQGGEKEGSCN